MAAQTLLRAQGAPEGNQNAAKVKVENINNPVVSRIVYGSTNAPYLTARLERDYPAIHRQVISGRLSAHAGMIKAGLQCHYG